MDTFYNTLIQSHPTQAKTAKTRLLAAQQHDADSSDDEAAAVVAETTTTSVPLERCDGSEALRSSGNGLHNIHDADSSMLAAAVVADYTSYLILQNTLMVF